jgi:hypothetical protein
MGIIFWGRCVMPVRDEEKRMEFLRSLSIEDLANRRITEYSSEVERHMIHEARESMKAKNDARFMQRHQKKANIDIQKALVNDIRRRGVNEIVGKEGGLSGGMVGTYVLPAIGLSGIGLAGLAAMRRGRGTGKILKKALSESQDVILRNISRKVQSGGTLKAKERDFVDILKRKVKNKKTKLSDTQAQRIENIGKALKQRRLNAKNPGVPSPSPPSPPSFDPAPLEAKLSRMENSVADLIKHSQEQNVLIGKQGALLRKQHARLKKFARPKTGQRSPKTNPPASSVSTNGTGVQWNKMTFKVNSPHVLPKGYGITDNKHSDAKWLLNIDHNKVTFDNVAESITHAAERAAKEGKTPEEITKLINALIDQSARSSKQHTSDAVIMKHANELAKAIKKKWITG